MSEYDVSLDAVGVAADAQKGKAETERLHPKAPPTAVKGARGGDRSTRCVRWMFHRKGEFCKICEKVGT